jgi:hypothetical protein
MSLTNESWAHFYNSSSSRWISDSISQENLDQTFTNSQSLISFISTSSFLNQHFNIDQLTKLSYLDNTLIRGSTYCPHSISENMYVAFSEDILLQTSICFMPLSQLLQSEYQDNLTTMVVVAPELSLILNDYIYVYVLPSTFLTEILSLFDSYMSSLVFNYNMGSTYYLLFSFYIWILVYILLTGLILSWVKPSNFQFVRFFYYIYSISRETRIQLEVVLQTLVFFVVYWIATLMTFDDNQEEVIELVDVSFFYFFTALIVYLFYKYSIHYFAFLEASVVEGRSVSFISKQVFKDFLNTLSLCLRFYILLFRINVYDTLDDFFDSYYIFVGDFDEDEYISEVFFSIHGSMRSLSENDFDTSFLMEDENDFFSDVFYLYFITWGKIFYFTFFMLEEAARLGLAFYVCYLITFEVHSVNCSYKEDNFMFDKKN